MMASPRSSAHITADCAPCESADSEVCAFLARSDAARPLFVGVWPESSATFRIETPLLSLPASTAVCGRDGLVQECVNAQEIDRDNWHRD